MLSMEHTVEDFNALAETLAAGVGDARGSLILSRDGLVLGAHPAEGESRVKPAWLRFASLGEPERGFVQFGTEIWSFVRRGPYAAFVVTGTAVRPGLVIDQIEQALLTAEEARARREVPPEPPPPSTLPQSRPRAPLHPEPRSVEQPVVIDAEPALEPEGAPEQVPTATSPGSEVQSSAPPPGPSAGSPTPEPAGEAPSPTASDEPTEPSRRAGVWASGGGEADDEEVDRFSLTREFSQLLQEGPDAADG